VAGAVFRVWLIWAGVIEGVARLWRVRSGEGVSGKRDVSTWFGCWVLMGKLRCGGASAQKVKDSWLSHRAR